jgi:ammonium transporter, Amt family
MRIRRAYRRRSEGFLRAGKAAARVEQPSQYPRRVKGRCAMINEANTGFMLLAASLVMLMTPGLAFFYGGLVGRSNTLTIMIQSFASMGITTVLWWAIGYSLCFSGGADGIYGNFHLAFLKGVTPDSIYGPSRIPLVVLIAYQMMFAIITPALITGAFTNRVSFKAYLIFLVVWQLFVYYPFVHMIWGNGVLAQWGVRDFAGGIVVHASAGWAALASVLYVGKRKFVDTPHNIPFIALGTGLLWFGWYGFNAGSELKVDGITAQAFLNTDIAASFAATTWLFVEWWHARKPHFVGLLTGAVAGLATITPAAGYVPIYASAVIGVVAGGVCYGAVLLKNRLRWDDALDVWGVHGVGGSLGILLLGVFASTAINPAGGVGLIHGSGSFFGKQLVADVACSAYAFVFTYVMLKVINQITPVRVGEAAEMGLDEAMHGETAYEDPKPVGGVAPAL